MNHKLLLHLLPRLNFHNNIRTGSLPLERVQFEMEAARVKQSILLPNSSYARLTHSVSRDSLFPFWLSPACIGTHRPQFVKPLSALWRCQECAHTDRVRLPARHTHSAGCIPRKSIRRSSLTSVFAQHYAARVKMQSFRSKTRERRRAIFPTGFCRKRVLALIISFIDSMTLCVSGASLISLSRWLSDVSERERGKREVHEPGN